MKDDRFKCKVCGRFGNCPMLTNDAWNQLKLKTSDIICFNCAEEILGRNITFADLKRCPANEPFTTMINRFVAKLIDKLRPTGII